MKLTDFLTDVGRPIAYFPKLKRITGSTTATILLCQFIYWRGKEADPEGWLYKTSDDIERETGLTYKEQKTARSALVSAGLLEEHYARLDHQMEFRLNLDEINRKWGMADGDVPESTNGSLGNDQAVQSINSITEITSETTTEINDGNVKTLSQKELDQANAKVDVMVENSRKVKYENREKIPEPYLALCDVYVDLTGQKPNKHVLMDWLGTFSDWVSEGLQPGDIRAAHAHAISPRGFLVVRPGSLTKTAVALRGSRLRPASAVPNGPGVVPGVSSGRGIRDPRMEPTPGQSGVPLNYKPKTDEEFSREVEEATRKQKRGT